MIVERFAATIQNVFLAAAETAAPAAPATNGQPPAGPDFMSTLWMFVPIMIIFWFLMIRPNQKRERERQEMLSKLAKGDRVVTSAGIVGTIVGVNDKSVVVRVSDEPPVKMEFLRAAITRVARDEKVTESK